jgi:hypothetical protein
MRNANINVQVLPSLDTNPEERLLDFVADLILDLAKTHPHLTQAQVALWLVRVAVGGGRS